MATDPADRDKVADNLFVGGLVEDETRSTIGDDRQQSHGAGARNTALLGNGEFLSRASRKRARHIVFETGLLLRGRVLTFDQRYPETSDDGSPWLGTLAAAREEGRKVLAFRVLRRRYRDIGSRANHLPRPVVPSPAESESIGGYEALLAALDDAKLAATRALYAYDSSLSHLRAARFESGAAAAILARSNRAAAAAADAGISS